ncbi:MAG: hypothetical protein KDC38_18485, partial [Planctomycetes bacterium]|nr:hypothetical protein [Planctomycetota bacterium]
PRVDPSHAQRTLLWNLDSRDWDRVLLDAFGIDSALLPRCVPTHSPFGSIETSVGAIPLTTVTGDQGAAIFASGTPAIGTTSVNLGTGAFIQVVAEGRAPVGFLTSIAADRTTVWEGVVNGAAAAIAGEAERDGIENWDAQDLDRWLDGTGDPPLFLNGVSGLGSPHWIADFPSAFIGDGSPTARLAAVAESIVFAVAANLRALGAHTPIRTIEAMGGLSRSQRLLGRLATVTGLSVQRRDDPEATVRGLAFLTVERPSDWTSPPPSKVPTDGWLGEPIIKRYHTWLRAMQNAVDR